MSKRLHSIIDKNRSHLKFGRLLYQRDSHNHLIFHYAVQLNTSQCLAWGPVHSNRPKDKGKITVQRISKKRFRSAKRVDYLEKDKIQQFLHISVDKFHKRWKYELLRFNCEHWARLITSGDCRCKQIKHFKRIRKTPIIGGIVVFAAKKITGAKERNRSAQKLIKEELRKR